MGPTERLMKRVSRIERATAPPSLHQLNGDLCSEALRSRHPHTSTPSGGNVVDGAPHSLSVLLFHDLPQQR